jgi:hypothetical protein
VIAGRALSRPAAGLAALLLAGCETMAAGPRGAPAPCDAEPPALQLMYRLLDRFNARDTPGWDATFHYPHAVSANGVVTLFTNPAQQAQTIPRLVEQGWARSEWAGMGVTQCAPGKAHVAATFVRYRNDGSVLSRTEALDVIELRDGKWGVTIRSLL